MLLLIIIVAAIAIFSITSSNNSKERHKAQLGEEMQRFYNDEFNCKVAEVVIKEALDKDNKWIRFLRLNHSLEIIITNVTISIRLYVPYHSNSQGTEETYEENIIGFLHEGKNPISSIQQECYAKAISDAINNSVPWITAFTGQCYQPSGFRVNISTKKGYSVPETVTGDFGLNIVVKPQYTYYSSPQADTNNNSYTNASSPKMNSSEAQEIAKLSEKFESLMVNEELNFESFSYFKYRIYFDVLVSCFIYSLDKNHENYMNAISKATDVENHINYSYSNQEIKAKLDASDEILRASQKINERLYNQNLIDISIDRIKTYKSLIMQTFPSIDKSSDEYIKAIQVMTACYLLEKKFCSIRSDLLSEMTDNYAKKD